MATIHIPYGTSHIHANIPDERLEGIMVSQAHHYQPEAGEAELIRMSLEEAIAAASAIVGANAK